MPFQTPFGLAVTFQMDAKHPWVTSYPEVRAIPNVDTGWTISRLRAALWRRTWVGEKLEPAVYARKLEVCNSEGLH